MDTKLITTEEVENRLKYSNGKIAILDELPGDESDFSVKLDGVLVILCLAGRLTITFDGKTFTAHKNDFIVAVPHTIFDNAMVSTDFKFRIVYISTEHAFKILPMQIRGWNLKLFFAQNPVLPLSANEADMFCHYYDLLKAKFEDTENIYREEVLDALMVAFIYDFGNLLDRVIGIRPRPLTSAEYIFESFVNMISSMFPKPRSVAYYADKLSITPKYLSVVCKKAGNMTASKLIDAYVLKDIERLLSTTRKSVKEISVELDFPNTSFFGRYVKKNRGCTPNELRRKLYGMGE